MHVSLYFLALVIGFVIGYRFRANAQSDFSEKQNQLRNDIAEVRSITEKTRASIALAFSSGDTKKSDPKTNITLTSSAQVSGVP